MTTLSTPSQETPPSSRLSDPPSSILDGDRIPAEESFDLPELEDFQEPLSKAEIGGNPSPTLIHLPTLGCSHTYRNNVQLTERRNEAIHIGSIHLDKYFLRSSSRAFSRRLLKDVLDNESNCLDELLTSVVRIPIEDGGYAYSIRRDYYSKLQAVLLKIKAKLGDVLLANGAPIPDIPFWGKAGDLDEFHLPNDFEILGICYRTEVERFLSIFDEHRNHQQRYMPPHTSTHSAEDDRPMNRTQTQTQIPEACGPDPRTQTRGGWAAIDPIAA